MNTYHLMQYIINIFSAAVPIDYKTLDWIAFTKKGVS